MQRDATNWQTPAGTVQRDAEVMLHTCEHVTNLTEGKHIYDTAMVLRLCRAVLSATPSETAPTIGGREYSFETALTEIANMPDESDEWDGAEKYQAARVIALDALKANAIFTPSATRSNVDTGNVRVRANVDTPSATGTKIERCPDGLKCHNATTGCCWGRCVRESLMGEHGLKRDGYVHGEAK